MPEIGKAASLYFHIPFCTKKCPYCHFYVLPDREELKELLLQGLHNEFTLLSPKFKDKEIVSIYFGGGTPFLFGPKRIETVLNWIRAASEAEITLEVNPEHVTLEAMQAYAALGINRISMGIQSLDESSLHLLGRNHSPRQAIKALEMAHLAGITNLSIDLMYDVPHQSLRSWRGTLERLRDLPITHLSLYNLTIEPQTAFFKWRSKLTPHLPSPELSLTMLQEAIKELEAIGLKRYEISAFAKSGYESKHNSGYWTGRPFLGLGPSAFSYWEGKRMRNIANLHTYHTQLAQGVSPIDFEEELPYPNNIHELLAIHLRLLSGVSLDLFDLPQSTLRKLHALHQKGWLTLDNRIKLTDLGTLFYDSVAEELI